MQENRESFVFYKDWYSAIKSRSPQLRVEIYDAIMEKVFEGTQKELSDIASVVVDLIFPQIDRDTEKWVATREKRSIAGKKHKGNQYSKVGQQNGTKWNKMEQNGTNGTSVPISADNNNNNNNNNIDNNYIKDNNIIIDDKNNKDNNILKEKEEIQKEKKKKPVFNFRAELTRLGVPDCYIDDWLTVRKTKRASNTQSALRLLINESKKAGIPVSQAVQICAENSWQGFKASYNLNDYKTQKERNRDILRQQREGRCGESPVSDFEHATAEDFEF